MFLFNLKMAESCLFWDEHEEIGERILAGDVGWVVAVSTFQDGMQKVGLLGGF